MFTFKAEIATIPVDIAWDAIPAASRLFLAEYGLRQYLNDGAAVPKKFTTGEHKGLDKSEELILTEKIEGVLARIDNILTGEFTRRTAAPKQSREERIREDVIMDCLRAAAASSNTRLPTKTGKNADPDLLQTFINRYYAKYRAEVDEIVARRLQEATVPVDLSDIFAPVSQTAPSPQEMKEPANASTQEPAHPDILGNTKKTKKTA